MQRFSKFLQQYSKSGRKELKLSGQLTLPPIVELIGQCFAPAVLNTILQELGKLLYTCDAYARVLRYVCAQAVHAGVQCTHVYYWTITDVSAVYNYDINLKWVTWVCFG